MVGPTQGAVAGSGSARDGAAPNAERDAELAGRRAAIAAQLRKTGEDALLFTREANVTYLTGYSTATWTNFSRPVAGVLGGDGELVVVVAETEADAVRERVSGADVRSYVELRPATDPARTPDGRVQFLEQVGEVLAAVLAEHGVRRLAVDGLEAAFPPVARLTELLPADAYELSDASALLWQHRLRKSDWEVERLRESCAVLEAAFAGLEAELAPGMTEREVHQALGAHVHRAGADSLGYTNVVAGVDRGLFGAPTDREWRAGEVLYVDGGAIVDGYWADFCRMYTAGGATTAQQEGYARAVKGLDEALASASSGQTAGDVARTIASACGLAHDAVGFGRFGHGIGLYMPEPPSLHPLDDTVLSDGFVLCVEPAVEHQGSNFVVEEQSVMRDGGLERLSPPAPRELIEIA